ncbi:MAG TPA: hypothetical protein VFE24_05215 [Pirellulales bacterium]|nr:hypothetical protein [Pirellulales bacterium]
MITLQCHSCGYKIQASDMLAGQASRCPRCKQIVRIPKEKPHLHSPDDPAPLAPAAPAVEPTLLAPAPLGLRAEHRYRPQEAVEGDDLQLQPSAPPPLRRPPARISPEPAVQIPDPAADSPDDADEYQLQPIAPPPLRKPAPAPPKRESKEAAAASDSSEDLRLEPPASPNSAARPPLRRPPPRADRSH